MCRIYCEPLHQLLLPIFRDYLLARTHHSSTGTNSGGGPWPGERADHAACCLNFGQEHLQILVTGGWDNDKNIQVMLVFWMWTVADEGD